MRGDRLNLPENLADKETYFRKWVEWSRLEGDCNAVFDYVGSKGITSIGAIGFCWGSWMVFKLSSLGYPIKAGANCHPSIVLENYAGSSPEALSETVQCPMTLATSRNDPDNIKEGGACANILTAKFPQSEIRTYGEVDHGWVSRGDIKDEVVSRNVKAALEQSHAFFSQHL